VRGELGQAAGADEVAVDHVVAGVGAGRGRVGGEEGVHHEVDGPVAGDGHAELEAGLVAEPDHLAEFVHLERGRVAVHAQGAVAAVRVRLAHPRRAVGRHTVGEDLDADGPEQPRVGRLGAAQFGQSLADVVGGAAHGCGQEQHADAGLEFTARGEFGVGGPVVGAQAAEERAGTAGAEAGIGVAGDAAGVQFADHAGFRCPPGRVTAGPSVRRLAGRSRPLRRQRSSGRASLRGRREAGEVGTDTRVPRRSSWTPPPWKRCGRRCGGR
jgi:hypothetical protein